MVKLCFLKFLHTFLASYPLSKAFDFLTKVLDQSVFVGTFVATGLGNFVATGLGTFVLKKDEVEIIIKSLAKHSGL